MGFVGAVLITFCHVVEVEGADIPPEIGVHLTAIGEIVCRDLRAPGLRSDTGCTLSIAGNARAISAANWVRNVGSPGPKVPSS